MGLLQRLKAKFLSEVRQGRTLVSNTKKEVGNYFGVGERGLGTFGRQVGNIARSQVQREIQPRIRAVRNTVRIADTLASSAIDRTQNYRNQFKVKGYSPSDITLTGQITKLAKPMIQGTARSIASLVPAVTKKPIQVNTTARKALFGNQYQDIQKPTIEGIRNLQDLGVGEQKAKKYGPVFGVAMTALDVIPGIGGKDDLVKGLVKATTKSGVKKLLPKIADDVAETIAKTTDAKAIRNLIKPQKAVDALKNEARVGRDYVADIKKDKFTNKSSSVFKLTSEANKKSLDVNNRMLEIAKSDQKIYDANKSKTIEQLRQEIADSKKFYDSVGGSYDSTMRVKKDIINDKLSSLPPSTEGAKPKINLTEKPQLNTSKFNISDKAKAKLDETVASVKTELEQVKGKVLKNEEVVDAAKASKILSREVDPNRTKQAAAAITRLRQEVAAGAEGKGLTKDFIENLKVLKSYSADAGRKLQAFNIQASPETSIKESVIADLVNLGKNSDELIEAAKGVNFDNPKQVTEFYRGFVKPKLGEVIDEYRYINLLSSPQTHIVNAFSNLIQGTVLNPATKLYSGIVDTIGSGLTGKARTAYVGEVPAYAKGFANSIADAVKQASEVFKGNKFVERPDINRIPTGKLGAGQYVLRALEAGDVFFRTMIKGGEMEALAYKTARSGEKLSQAQIEKQASDIAEYFVFRKALDPSNKTGQGAVLSAIDKATQAVYKFRNVPGVSWLVPFVQTPMNILKQGIEYSPLGLTTLAGNTNKTQQVAKSLIGSTVLAGAATLDSTWSAPTGEAEKKEFYASGRKPYSVKIGDNWVSYSKLGPLAYPMAMAAAVKWYFRNDPKATSTDMTDKTVKMLGGIAGFFADQSYLSGMGDLLDIARGEQYAIKNAISNFGRQLVPLASLQGWVARQLDPIYREGKTVTDKLKSGIPLMSKSVPAYTDPLGNPSVRMNNTFNSFSPIQVNPVNQQFEDIYQQRQINKRSNAEAEAMIKGTDQIKTLPDGRVAVVINNEVKKFDNQKAADVAIKGDDFIKSGKKELITDDYVFEKADTGKGYKATPRIDYEIDVRDGTYGTLATLKKNKDIEGWMKEAETLVALYDAKLQDPDITSKEKRELEGKKRSLEDSMSKYASYGGFTKGGGSSKAKKEKTYNLATVQKVNIKTTKPAYTTKIRSQRPKRVKFKSPKIKTYKLKAQKAPKLKKLRSY